MNFKNNTIADNRMDLGSQAPLEWPLAIYVEPSGYCNFKCKFCVNSTKELKKENMDFGLFKKFVDEIMDKGAVIPLMRFCGFGESVINQKFLDMLRYIDDCRNMKADNRGGGKFNPDAQLQLPPGGFNLLGIKSKTSCLDDCQP